MLAASNFGEYTVGLHPLVETPKEAVESLPFGQTYFSQLGLPICEVGTNLRMNYRQSQKWRQRLCGSPKRSLARCEAAGGPLTL